MFRRIIPVCLVLCVIVGCEANQTGSSGLEAELVTQLIESQQEVRDSQQKLETRIAELETKLAELEKAPAPAATRPAPSRQASAPARASAPAAASTRPTAPSRARPLTSGPAIGDAFLGDIKMFAGNFAPRGWAFCNGQILPISQNSALFSLLGTMYGGDGRTTFGLPDMRGRAPVHVGSGPGLSQQNWGQKAGAESISPSAPTEALAASDDSTEQVTAVGAEEASNMQPYLGINYIIALSGTFPSRS